MHATLRSTLGSEATRVLRTRTESGLGQTEKSFGVRLYSAMPWRADVRRTVCRGVSRYAVACRGQLWRTTTGAETA